MKLCDWILIPYDKSKYILSSSGVMFDSIEEERPFFALDSKCFKKAIEAGCGIRETTIDALGERIIEEINGQDSGGYSQYSKNISNYKKKNRERKFEGVRRNIWIMTGMKRNEKSDNYRYFWTRWKFFI